MNTAALYPRRVAVLVTALVVVGTGGTALATVTASDAPTIKACAKRGTGELRLAKSCKSNERSVSWNQQAPVGPAGSKGYAYVTADKAMVPTTARGVTAMTRSADGDYYCFDLSFTPVSVVVSAGLGGSYIVADVVGPSTLAAERAAALCGTSAVDAVVYFPAGESGFYATFN
jgi:hypothetical protein